MIGVFGFELDWGYIIGAILAFVVTFGLYKWGVGRELLVQWALNTSRTVIEKFEAEIKKIDADTGKNYWVEINDIYDSLFVLQNREDKGSFLDWIIQGYEFYKAIVAFLKETKLDKYF